jgi:hypothetical protein
MYILFQWVSGLVFGFELLTYEDIGMDGNGFIFALNLGLFRICVEIDNN